MMFLVIFGSLAAAMAIVAQGNLATADSHLKINRTLAAAETGQRFLIYRINQVTATVKTTAGEISTTNAPTLWDQVRAGLLTSLSGELHSAGEPYPCNWPDINTPAPSGLSLHVGPITLAPGAPTFTAVMTPHPIAGENYNAAYYQRPPYSTMTPAVSNASPLDSTWVRMRVWASEGPSGRQVTRAIQMDFQIQKKIRYALLSRSRVMIGSNVMIEGPIGSRFLDTHLANGHPIQMVSDFRGLNSQLDTKLVELTNALATNDQNGDNRLNVDDSREIEGIDDAQALDKNGDGFIDDYDFFMAHYDTQDKGYVTALDMNAAGDIHAAQLLQMIDTFGDPTRTGYGDGQIDDYDRYAKVRGEVKMAAELNGWQDGAAGGTYQSYFQGPIVASHDDAPLSFQASELSVPQFGPGDFDVTTFRNLATGDLAAQAVAQAANHDPSDPNSPQPLGTQVREAVPYGAAHPYDYYDRPVYENMTFTNVKIPKGNNAVFKSCKFIGCTFVETNTSNTDSNYNYVGMQEADGIQKFPTLKATVNGVQVSNTKPLSNNLRFDNCTFEGAVVSDAPQQFTHTRNKIAFTGRTRFIIQDSLVLNATQKALFRRSTLLMPHYSVEMGSFINPSAANETVQLSGTIVAGLIDMRGQVKVEGTVLTTFEPKANTGPVIGDTSPQFNTTLGYFASLDGDLESEIPTGGRGVIQLRYDATLPLPDGILAPISLAPNYHTYFEMGAQ
ncbi:MAG: hypothetical protein WD042_04015 [Phycisphaeraceae bacterium]